MIEITIKPWDPADQRNAEVSCGTLVSMHPFHADEEGKVYFRTQASSRQVHVCVLRKKAGGGRGDIFFSTKGISRV